MGHKPFYSAHLYTLPTTLISGFHVVTPYLQYLVLVEKNKMLSYTNIRYCDSTEPIFQNIQIEMVFVSGHVRELGHLINQ
ncbi:MAG: hypothetical protein CM15mP64_7520 [Candidatus Neomarinimicrobiota bacterium]|nr:MAG: hypothetical protein CM15mP64_7520 [Candidatus Neomarinimicrobiota bacterium]